MAGVLRFLLACVALPFAWAVACTLFDVFRLIPASDDAIISPGALAVAAGCAVQMLLWWLLPLPMRAYVLGHELTHAVVGLLFGARVSNIRVAASGGSVTLSKSNLLITLAPYFVPFYTVLVALAALITRAFVSPLPWPWAWLFAVGFTWCFHCGFTLRALLQRQPDILEYGRLFSYVFIWIVNVAGVAVWIACAANIPWRACARAFTTRVTGAYAAVGHVAALPFRDLEVFGGHSGR